MAADLFVSLASKTATPVNQLPHPLVISLITSKLLVRISGNGTFEWSCTYELLEVHCTV